MSTGLFQMSRSDSFRTSPTAIFPARSTQHGTTIPSHLTDIEYHRKVQGTYLEPSLLKPFPSSRSTFPPKVWGGIIENLSTGSPSNPFKNLSLSFFFPSPVRSVNSIT